MKRVCGDRIVCAPIQYWRVSLYLDEDGDLFMDIICREVQAVCNELCNVSIEMRVHEIYLPIIMR